MCEPTALEMGIVDRMQMGLPPVGPLTQAQQDTVDAYERYCVEREADYQAEQAAGGRTICIACGMRSVVHSSVCTLGYPGHPGAEFSDYARCENCGHSDLA